MAFKSQKTNILKPENTYQVMVNEENVNTIDMTKFHSGVYIIKIKTDKGESIKQFIKK